jgi:ABC-type sugar transport system permease subunit
MMRKIAKWIFLALGIVLLGVFVFVAVNFKHVAAFPSIISSFYSKEFCSCYFVTEGTEEQCHNFARQWVPIQSFALDKEKRTVTVKGLFVTTTARYTGDRYGCVLEPWR